MSTISDALRKAQQQKTSDSLPDTGRPSAPLSVAGRPAVRLRAPVAHAGGRSPRRTAAFIALGVSLLLAAVLCVWILNVDTAPEGSRERERPLVETAPAGKGATADAVAPTGSPAPPPVAGIVPPASPAAGTSHSAPLAAPPSLRAESAPAAAPSAPTAASAAAPPPASLTMASVRYADATERVPPGIGTNGLRHLEGHASSSPNEEAAIARIAAPPPAPPPDVPALTGVFYAEVNPMAIIAGETVKEGDAVGRYRVVKIEPESVTLTAGGEPVVLRMKR